MFYFIAFIPCVLTFWPLAVPSVWAMFPVVTPGGFESVTLVYRAEQKNIKNKGEKK